MKVKTVLSLVLIFALCGGFDIALAIAPPPLLWVEATPSKTEVRVNEPFKVALKVDDTSGSNQTVRVMSCSWYDEWQTSDTNVIPKLWPCTRNFPVDVTIPPGGAYTNEMEMSVDPSFSGKTLSFRMGFTPIGSAKTFWSDYMTLKILPTDTRDTRASSTTDASARQHFQNYLDQCGTNEIRCLWFLGDNPAVGMVMTIDLSRETVFTVRDVYDWAEQSAKTRTLSHSQMRNLKEMMNALPMPDSDNDFSESVFVSVRSGDRTLVFRYNRRYIPPTVRSIYDIAGGYLESSNTTSYDGKDLGAALRKIAEEIPELAVDSITNAPALPDVAWNGDAVARAIFLLPKHLRYRTNIMSLGPRQIPMMDLEVTAVRYDSSKDAEQAVKGSLKGRQAAPQAKENYRGFTLYRFAPEYGVVICQAGRYVVEIDPLSEAVEPLVMKTLDVVLAGLPKIADGKETTKTQ